MKRFLAAVLLVASGALGADAEILRPPDTHFFHESFGDLEEELATARGAGKFGVMIMFEVNDCPWCERMKRTVLNRVVVQDYFRSHFQVLMLNAEGDAPLTDFDGNEVSEKEFALERNRVRATPTFLFFGPAGELAFRYTGTTKDPEEFILLGRYVAEGHYKNEKFVHFKRKMRESS